MTNKILGKTALFAFLLIGFVAISSPSAFAAGGPKPNSAKKKSGNQSNTAMAPAKKTAAPAKKKAVAKKKAATKRSTTAKKHGTSARKHGTSAKKHATKPAKKTAKKSTQKEVTEDAAKAIAMKRANGTVEKSETGTNKGRAVYEFAIRNPKGKIRDIWVDQKTGRVVRNAVEK